MKKNEKIRVGLLIDSYNLPLWANLMIKKIKNSEFAEIILVILNNLNKGNQKSSNQTYSSNRFYNAYLSFEEKRLRPKIDLSRIQSCKELSNIDEIIVNPISDDYDVFPESDLEKIKHAKPDVLIRLGFGRLSGDILTIPSYGVWSYCFTKNYWEEIKYYGFWEMFNKKPVTETRLYLNKNLQSEDKILARAFTATDPWYVKRNNNSKYEKNIHLIPNKLREVHILGWKKIVEDIDSNSEELLNFKKPSNKEIVQFWINHIVNYVKIKRKYKNKIEQWSLLFDFNKEISNLKEFKKIIPPDDRYYADPFVIKKNNEYFVFIEEFLLEKKKGHISLMKFDKNGNYSKAKKILELPYHLSYPFIFELNNEYYMIPETSENQTIDLYRCVEFPDKWEFKKHLFENIKATDTTILNKDGLWWLFTSEESICNASYDTLSLYYTENLLKGKWISHPKNPIILDVRKARSAGKIFRMNEDIIRPSQDCSDGYGRGLVFNKIVTINEFDYDEVVVERIYPDWDKKIEGIHTYAKEDNFKILDYKFLKNK